MLRELPKRQYTALLLVLFALNVYFYSAIAAPTPASLETFAVGKGAATLVRAGGETILVNTGPDASVLRALGDRLPPWQRMIDVLVLTSAAQPEVGGLHDVEARYAIGKEVPIRNNTRLTLTGGTTLDIILSETKPIAITLMQGTVVLKASQ